MHLKVSHSSETLDSNVGVAVWWGQGVGRKGNVGHLRVVGWEGGLL